MGLKTLFQVLRPLYYLQAPRLQGGLQVGGEWRYQQDTPNHRLGFWMSGLGPIACNHNYTRLLAKSPARRFGVWGPENVERSRGWKVQCHFNFAVSKNPASGLDLPLVSREWRNGVQL